MAKFNFPNSPSTNDEYTANSVTWKWDGAVWRRQTGVGAPTGPQGVQGTQGHQGVQGAVGAQGHQGVQGAAGAAGAQGAVGAQGATGAGGGAGAQGHQGVQGAGGAAGSATISNNAAERVITGGSGTNLNGESNLTFDGGVLTVTGQAVIDQVNINDNVVQLNGGSNPLKIRGQGTGGSQHLTLDDDVTIVGDLTVQGIGGFVTGMILLWSGAANAIPSGWTLCNGSNSTPDLRNRFVIGSGSSYNVGAQGGSKDAVVVSHNHDVTDPQHDHNVEVVTDSGSGPAGSTVDQNSSNGNGYVDTTGIRNASTGISIQNRGVSGTDKNLPPYYALCYIMKT